VVLLAICALLPATAFADEPFTNDDVVTLTELGLDEAVIVGKVRQAPVVSFALETDDLVALKDRGVAPGVIAAMLARATADQAPSVLGTTSPGATAEVTLITDDGEFELLGNAGNYSMTHAFVTVLAFMDYVGTDADIRTLDATPTFRVATERNPKSAYFLCKAEQDEDDDKRSVKAGQIGMWGAQSVMRPDSDWTLGYEVTDLGGGVWELVPEAALEPGEYAIWKAAGETTGTWNAYLFDFAVDPDPNAPPPPAEPKKKNKKKKK